MTNPFQELEDAFNKSGVGNVQIDQNFSDESVYLLSNLYIESDKRNQKYATTFMKELVKICDSMKIKMVLEPSDYFGSDLKRLVEFYSRFGFTPYLLNNRVLHMKRIPNVY